MHMQSEERAITLGIYILEHQTTVRAAAKHFGISKSTVHMDVPKGNGKNMSLCDKEGHISVKVKLRQKFH
ncbi:MAG: sporulation transcriptional regulator SpoIIID [Oscillospiraceae bacterium]